MEEFAGTPVRIGIAYDDIRAKVRKIAVTGTVGGVPGSIDLKPDFQDNADIFTINAAYDFSTLWKIQPYAGLGGGIAYLRQAGNTLALSATIGANRPAQRLDLHWASATATSISIRRPTTPASTITRATCTCSQRCSGSGSNAPPGIGFPGAARTPAGIPAFDGRDPGISPYTDFFLPQPAGLC